MRGRWILIAPLALLGMALFILIGGLVVRELWNWLLPPLFGWPTLTFWQALGMLALCRILFGGLGLHSSDRSRSHRRMRRRWAEKWERMTPEERARFRMTMRGRWGFTPRAEEPKPAPE